MKNLCHYSKNNAGEITFIGVCNPIWENEILSIQMLKINCLYNY